MLLVNCKSVDELAVCVLRRVIAPAPPADAADVQVVPLLVNTFPEVLGATKDGVDVPFPNITLLAVSVPSPVPPCATVTAALLVKIVAVASGSVNVFSLVVGPLILVNPFPVPPYVEAMI